MKPINSQALLLFLILFVGSFFFWNLSLYSDRLCQENIHRLENEKVVTSARLLTQLHQVQQDKEQLQVQLDEKTQLSQDVQYRLEQLQKALLRGIPLLYNYVSQPNLTLSSSF